MKQEEVVHTLRRLIIDSAPERSNVDHIKKCDVDDPLDRRMPFSSIMVLGVIVAVEDHFGIRITKDAFQRTITGGVTLTKLASMIQQLQQGRE